MKVGVAIPSSANGWKVAQRAEALGFNSIWFWDSPLVCGDPFAAIAAAAVQTSTIRLGTGVYVPAFRSPVVTASGIATLNALAPGRINFCAGTGTTSVRTMDERPMKMEAFEEHMRVAFALLRGEAVDLQVEGRARNVQLIHQDTGLINIDDPIDLYIAAGGPKMRAMTARFGVGWVNTVGPYGPGVEEDAADMRRKWAEAGRNPEDLVCTNAVGGLLLREGEDFSSPRVRAASGPCAQCVVHVFADLEANLGQQLGFPIEESVREAIDDYKSLYKPHQDQGDGHLWIHRGHCMYIRPEEDHIVTPELIRDLSMTATIEDMDERIGVFRKAGIDEFIVTCTVGQEDCLDDWADYFAL